jgi:LysR family transcriptional regulator, transcription activator of glutamate synthase operon
MELRQLEYFIEVAKREHVTEAAESLHVAQSSVSRQIFNLESELGVDLFIREGRRVKLTPIGKLFLERIKPAMNIMEQAKSEVKEFLDPKQGTVRIAFPISMAAYTIPNIIHAFRHHYPKAKFEMNNALHHDLIDGVINGDFNLAIVAPMPKNNNKLTGKILFTEKTVALLPIHHPLADRSSIRLRELKDDPFVILPEGYTFRDQIINACNDAGFTPEIAFEGKDIEALKGLTSVGLGIAIMPETTLVDNAPKSTVTVPIVDPSITRTVGVIIPTQRKLLPTEKLFYDFLLQFYEKLNDFME